MVTTGYGAVVEAALERAGLRGFFVEVIGREHPLSMAMQGRKERILQELRRAEGLSAWQARSGNSLPQLRSGASKWFHVLETAWI